MDKTKKCSKPPTSLNHPNLKSTSHKSPRSCPLQLVASPRHAVHVSGARVAPTVGHIPGPPADGALLRRGRSRSRTKCINNTLMGLYGILYGLMGLYGILNVLMGLYGILNVLMGTFCQNGEYQNPCMWIWSIYSKYVKMYSNGIIRDS